MRQKVHASQGPRRGDASVCQIQDSTKENVPSGRVLNRSRMKEEVFIYEIEYKNNQTDK